MNRTWHIAAKEFQQARRDRLAFLFTLVLPVIFTIFLGVVISGGEESSGSSLPVAIADSDQTRASQQLVARLEASPLLATEVKTEAEVDATVLDQDVAAAVVIPEGFGAAVGQGRPATVSVVRLETSTGGQSVRTAVEEIVSEFNASMLATDAAAEQVSAKTGRALDSTLRDAARSSVDSYLATPAVAVQSTEAGGTSVLNATGFDLSSSGALVNWVLFSLLTVATGLVWERRQGLLRRLSAVGVPGVEIVSGKMMAMVVIAFTQQLLLVLLGQLAFGVDYFNNPLALLMTMISLSVLAASLGMLVSSVFRSERAVIATVVISAQLLAALGGAWFPLEVTSASFSRVAHFLPTAWIMDSLHGIILKDWGVADVLFPLAIVWIWIVVLFGTAVWRFRPE
jgi:ABC-type multidrug transport system permease subunit